MPFILSILTNKTVMSVIAILVAILGAYTYVSHLKNEITNLTLSNETLTQNVATYKTTITDLEQSIANQNIAINTLQHDSEARVKANELAVTIAQTSAKNYKQQAEDLLKKQPAQNVAKCDSANSLVNGELIRDTK